MFTSVFPILSTRDVPRALGILDRVGMRDDGGHGFPGGIRAIATKEPTIGPIGSMIRA